MEMLVRFATLQSNVTGRSGLAASSAVRLVTKNSSVSILIFMGRARTCCSVAGGFDFLVTEGLQLRLEFVDASGFRAFDEGDESGAEISTGQIYGKLSGTSGHSGR